MIEPKERAEVMLRAAARLSRISEHFKEIIAPEIVSEMKREVEVLHYESSLLVEMVNK